MMKKKKLWIVSGALVVAVLGLGITFAMQKPSDSKEKAVAVEKAKKELPKATKDKEVAKEQTAKVEQEKEVAKEEVNKEVPKQEVKQETPPKQEQQVSQKPTPQQNTSTPPKQEVTKPVTSPKQEASKPVEQTPPPVVEQPPKCEIIDGWIANSGKVFATQEEAMSWAWAQLDDANGQWGEYAGFWCGQVPNTCGKVSGYTIDFYRDGENGGQNI